MKKSVTKKPTLKERKTHTFDASGQVLGRLATRIATLLRGKHKVSYQPHIDGGDFVVVTNAKQVKITGLKLEQKKYYHYSGYPGGMKVKQLGHMMEKDPSDVLRRVVYQMLPPTRLRKGMINRLTIQS
ncbi:MAG: 50S ribosomal protein L13 [Patescibacteria group bacterium]